MFGITFHYEVKKYLAAKGYTMKNKLGTGSFGTIYKVFHKKSKQYFSAKIIKLFTYYVKEMFLNVYLQNQNKIIPYLKEVFVEESKDKSFCILIYEYFPMDLFEYIRDRKEDITQKEVKQIFYQILKGIQFLHHNSLLFNDCTPCNILINDKKSEKIIKFIDYGSITFEKLIGNCGKDGMNFNIVTANYRPLEVFFGIPIKGKPSGTHVDVWSIGCAICEFYTKEGRMLFNGEDELFVFNNILKFFSMKPIRGDEYSCLHLNSKFYTIMLKKTATLEKLKEFMPLCKDNDDLIFFQKLLVPNVLKRPTIDELLKDKYFEGVKKDESVCKKLPKEFFEMFVEVYSCLKRRNWYNCIFNSSGLVDEFEGYIKKRISYPMKLLNSKENIVDEEEIHRFAKNSKTFLEFFRNYVKTSVEEMHFTFEPIQEHSNKLIQLILEKWKKSKK